MLATSIDTLTLPSAWYPVFEQIQLQRPQPPTLRLLDSFDSHFGYVSGTATTMARQPVAQNSIESLGWSAAEALETHLRLRTFADDWDAPGMEAYDEL